jgi:DNA invertase Pin-like site-specific DNA recombinase
MSRRVALYARVSTADQHTEPQLHALRAYAQARGLEIAAEYVDHGVSGAKGRRPALDRLMADAQRRRFDAVCVVKLDRLGRSLHHLLSILGELDSFGVAFVSLDDAIDTSTAAGRLFMQMRGAFAEYELDMIRERTRAGLAAAKRRGKRLGRPKAIRGPDCFTLERRLREGASLSAIARELGCAVSTVSLHAKRLRDRSAA